MRPEIVTRITNTDEPLLKLQLKVTGDDGIEIQEPPDRAHMPERYALLFVLNQDGPVSGRFVRLEQR